MADYANDVLVDTQWVEDHLSDLVPDDWSGLRLVFAQGAEPKAADGWQALETWLREQDAVDPHRDQGGDALASMMYSSGTTGRPKGVTTTVVAAGIAVSTPGVAAVSRGRRALAPPGQGGGASQTWPASPCWVPWAWTTVGLSSPGGTVSCWLHSLSHATGSCRPRQT